MEDQNVLGQNGKYAGGKTGGYTGGSILTDKIRTTNTMK